MKISDVDPFNVDWEERRPVYRVHLWSRPGSPPSRTPAGTPTAWTSASWQITEASDVSQVIGWAIAQTAAEDQFTIYVEAVDGGKLGLLRLAGSDPTDPDG